QIAEKLKLRIRASLQRCRKVFELRCPFRGCAPKTEFFTNLLRNKEVLHDSQSNLRSTALHKGKEFLPTEGSKYRPDRRRARPPTTTTVTTPAPCRNDLRCLERLSPEPCPAKPLRYRNYVSDRSRRCALLLRGRTMFSVAAPTTGPGGTFFHSLWTCWKSPRPDCRYCHTYMFPQPQSPTLWGFASPTRQPGLPPPRDLGRRGIGCRPNR